MAPGDHLTDAVTLIVSWYSGADVVGYAAGFSPSFALPGEALTAYDGPGRHSQTAEGSSRWVATVEFTDEAGNTNTVGVGPFFIGSGD